VTVRCNRSTENLIGVVEVSAPPISVCKDHHREEVLGRRNAKRSGATNLDLGRSCDEFRLDTARRADLGSLRATPSPRAVNIDLLGYFSTAETVPSVSLV